MLNLAVFDLDGTLRVERSPWRHLHSHLGLSNEAKEYFPMFQRGEITYERWVELDAALWTGRSRSEILSSHHTNPFRRGAHDLVRHFLERDIVCAAISTGLDVLARETCDEVGIGELHSNKLIFDGDICRGTVDIQVSEHNKADVLSAMMLRHGASRQNTIVFGDGSADIPMFKMVDTSVAIFPSSEEVRAAASIVVDAEPISDALAQITA